MRLPDGATLRHVTVPQDSRCPPDVQCIRAGDADIEFAFTPLAARTVDRATLNVSVNTATGDSSPNAAPRSRAT